MGSASGVFSQKSSMQPFSTSTLPCKSSKALLQVLSVLLSVEQKHFGSSSNKQLLSRTLMTENCFVVVHGDRLT